MPMQRCDARACEFNAHSSPQWKVGQSRANVTEFVFPSFRVDTSKGRVML